MKILLFLVDQCERHLHTGKSVKFCNPHREQPDNFIKVKNSSIGYLFENKRMNFNLYIILYPKIYPKCIIDRNVKPKIIKLLKENIREKFYGLE